MKTIVAPLTFGFDEAASLPAVISTPKALDAHLDAIFMGPDPEAAFFYSGMLPSERFEEGMRQEMEESVRAAALTSRRRFERLCRKAGIASAQKPRRADAATARWREEKADPASIFPAIARTADLAIFSGQTAASDFLRGSLLEATLLGSGNLVLYLPEAENGAVFNRTLIAWDGGTACVRAISTWLSMGFTPQETTILCIVDPGEDMPQPDGLKIRLAWHGINARTEKRNRGYDSVADSLIKAAKETECGIIVMGGYGRFRYSEALFGGVTRGVLQRARVPVLMMH